MPATHTLVLFRHAKASPDRSGDDHERPLIERGERDARAAGRYLAGEGLAADLVLCSTALRARQTWDGAVEGGAQASEVRYLDEIYDAPVDDLMAVLRGADESATTLVMVGHAPGIPDLLDYVGATESESAAWQAAEEDYPTCALAVLRTELSWANTGRGTATLTTFHTPKGGASTR